MARSHFRRLIAAPAVVAFLVILTGAYVARTEGALPACMSIPLRGTSIGDMVTIQWTHMAHRVMASLAAVLMPAAIIRARGVGYSVIASGRANPGVAP